METEFYDYANLIIEHYEGGYYNPKMKEANPSKYAVMGDSGETLFGIDRKAGGSDVNTGKGEEFWKLVDNAGAASKWGYNYKPTGILGLRLRNLAAEMMYQRYEKYTKNLSTKAAKLVKKSPKLQVHLYYGCWNGPGNLGGFIDVINKAVQSGTTNITKLEKVALDSRKNHAKAFMRERAKNMEAIWAELPNMRVKRIIKRVLLITGITGAVGVTGWLIWRKVK